MRRTKNRGAEPGQAVPALQDNPCEHFPLPWGTRWFWKGAGLYGVVCQGDAHPWEDAHPWGMLIHGGMLSQGTVGAASPQAGSSTWLPV